MKNNIFDNLPQGKLPEEVFEILHQSGQVKLARIISTGQSSDWYDQVQDEWVVLLRGEARLMFEGDYEINLGPGDYVFIEAHKKHKVSWTSSDETCVWLALYLG